MTEDRPSGAELLETAADSLREEVLPGVPTEHRLTLLMVLNAGCALVLLSRGWYRRT